MKRGLLMGFVAIKAIRMLAPPATSQPGLRRSSGLQRKMAMTQALATRGAIMINDAKIRFDAALFPVASTIKELSLRVRKRDPSLP